MLEKAGVARGRRASPDGRTGDLIAQRVQRYAPTADLDRYETNGSRKRENTSRTSTPARVLYAGWTTRRSWRQAEAEADVVIVGRRQQRLPILQARTLFVVVADPLRPGP